MQMIIHVKTFELSSTILDNKHLTTVMRVLQVISGCIAACWLLLIAFAQFNCSIFPGFGHQCSRGEGDIWLLPFIYSPVGGVGLIVWLVIIGIRRYSPQTQPTSGPVTALVVDAPLIPVDAPIAASGSTKNETHTSNTQNHWQPTRAAIIGGIVAFVVLVWSLRADLENSPLGLFLVLLPYFVPTFFVYTALVASLLRLKAKPDAAAGAVLLAALIPFSFWATGLIFGLSQRATEQAAIAALPKAGFPKNVNGIVIDGDNGGAINCARHLILTSNHNFADVLTRGQIKEGQYLKFTQETAKSPVDEGRPIDSPPEDYLLIHFPRRSQFLADRISASVTDPSIEIYSVGLNKRQLVAVTYAADNRLPAFPPMLTLFGWYPRDATATSEKSCQNVARFLQRELINKMS